MSLVDARRTAKLDVMLSGVRSYHRILVVSIQSCRTGLFIWLRSPQKPRSTLTHMKPRIEFVRSRQMSNESKWWLV